MKKLRHMKIGVNYRNHFELTTFIRNFQNNSTYFSLIHSTHLYFSFNIKSKIIKLNYLIYLFKMNLKHFIFNARI